VERILVEFNTVVKKFCEIGLAFSEFMILH
jgi:hypothetical protein